MAEATETNAATPPMLPAGEEQKYAAIMDNVTSCIKAGEDYRDRFRDNWDEIEKQVRMVPPAAWDKKEEWQSKVYVGIQAKTSESAYSNLVSMVFPSESFFNISATKQRDRDEESALEDLFKVMMNRGGFYPAKDFVLEEAIDHGTSWLKMMVKRDKSGFDFTWRSCYDCLVDPDARTDWNKARYWVDQYMKDVEFLVDEIRKGDQSIYEQDQLKKGLAWIESQASSMRQEEIERIRGIDGTSYIMIPKAYKRIMLNEFWGLLPEPVDKDKPNGQMKLVQKVVTLINKDFIIRCDDNPYGFIPAVPGIIKPRKYDFYGKGFLLNGMGTQELMNSMINLGFDSAKICSMDISVLDAERIADPASIQYKPLAVWLVKGSPNDAVKMTRSSAASAMGDILNGMGILDTIHQDVTGVTRQSEGSQAITPSGEDNTLGEYKLKMAAIDKRFVSVAKRFEEMFIKTLLQNMYKVVINKKLFSQEACNEMIGFKPIMLQDPVANVSVKVGEMPRLNIEDLGKKDVMAWNFSASGVMQFSQRQEIMQKLQQALTAALQNPTLTALTNIDTLWRRIFQVSEIPDWEEIVKSKEDVEKLKQFLSGMQGGVPQGGGVMPSKIGPPAGIPTRPAGPMPMQPPMQPNGIMPQQLAGVR